MSCIMDVLWSDWTTDGTRWQRFERHTLFCWGRLPSTSCPSWSELHFWHSPPYSMATTQLPMQLLNTSKSPSASFSSFLETLSTASWLGSSPNEFAGLAAEHPALLSPRRAILGVQSVPQLPRWGSPYQLAYCNWEPVLARLFPSWG